MQLADEEYNQQKEKETTERIKTRTSIANQAYAHPINTFAFFQTEKYRLKSDQLARGAITLTTIESGSKAYPPVLKNLSMSSVACFTFRSMSIVNLGVSGIVRRNQSATTAGAQPRPIRIRQERSMERISAGSVDGALRS